MPSSPDLTALNIVLPHLGYIFFFFLSGIEIALTFKESLQKAFLPLMEMENELIHSSVFLKKGGMCHSWSFSWALWDGNPFWINSYWFMISHWYSPLKEN